MGQENVLSTLRALLILAGSFLVGHNLFGRPVDASTWQTVSGAVLTVAAGIWGVASKTASIEGLESAARSVITAIGGLLASAGMLSGNNVSAIIGFVTALMPALQSYLSKTKGQAVAIGAITNSAVTGKGMDVTPKVTFFQGTQPPIDTSKKTV